MDSRGDYKCKNCGFIFRHTSSWVGGLFCPKCGSNAVDRVVEPMPWSGQ